MGPVEQLSSISKLQVQHYVLSVYLEIFAECTTHFGFESYLNVIVDEHMEQIPSNEGKCYVKRHIV